MDKIAGKSKSSFSTIVISLIAFLFTGMIVFAVVSNVQNVRASQGAGMYISTVDEDSEKITISIKSISPKGIKESDHFVSSSGWVYEVTKIFFNDVTAKRTDIFLKGSDGADGLNGVNGTDGEQGLKGNQGEQGKQGEQGIQGYGFHYSVDTIVSDTLLKTAVSEQLRINDFIIDVSGKMYKVTAASAESYSLEYAFSLIQAVSPLGSAVKSYELFTYEFDSSTYIEVPFGELSSVFNVNYSDLIVGDIIIMGNGNISEVAAIDYDNNQVGFALVLRGLTYDRLQAIDSLLSQLDDFFVDGDSMWQMLLGLEMRFNDMQGDYINFQAEFYQLQSEYMQTQNEFMELRMLLEQLQMELNELRNG